MQDFESRNGIGFHALASIWPHLDRSSLKETDVKHPFVSQEDWLIARKDPLAKKRAMFHELDALRAR